MAIADYLNKLVELKNELITNLRNKGVEVSDDEKLNTLVPKVNEVETGIDTSDATATAEDMAEGVTAYVNNEKITGVLPRWSGTVWNSPSLEFQQEEGRLHVFGNTGTTKIMEKGSGNASMYIAKDRLGNATADDVAKGKTFTSAEGLMVEGTAETVEQNVAINSSTFAKNDSGVITAITIPYGVTTIAANAFNGCELTSITIPDSVTTIEQTAFCNNASLETLTIPNTVKSINTLTICTGNTNLKTVTLPDCTTSISTKAFNGCTNLTSINIPIGVKQISTGAFNGCTNLADIYYEGTEEQWSAITRQANWNINMGSNVTGGTVIHYNYVPE